jgi:hypothetical protein
VFLILSVSGDDSSYPAGLSYRLLASLYSLEGWIVFVEIRRSRPAKELCRVDKERHG